MKKDKSTENIAASTVGVGLADVWAMKRAGQARDLERQRQGTLRGTDIGRGMAEVVKRAKRLAY